MTRTSLFCPHYSAIVGQCTAVSLSILLCAFTASAADKPNVLFILVDDMGWRDLACYGHEIHKTPNIDALAARGMRFTNAYAACPICAPSRAAIMTGKFPSNTGFVDNYASQLSGKTLQRSRTRQFLKLEEVTLAEALKTGGYQTGFLGKWHLSVGMEPRLPTDQGFDVNVAGSFWGHPLKGYFSPWQMPNLKDGPKGEYLTDRLTSEAIGVMDDFSKRDKPWLLYMRHYPVGVPHIAHSKPGSVIGVGDWKFLRFYGDGREELYNLKTDIGETKNLVASMPEKATGMKSRLVAMLKEHGAKIPVPDPASKKK